MTQATFKLDDAFVEKYRAIPPKFGFNGLGEIVYMRTYSRIKSDGTNEKWFETVRRVVEGTYRMQERHIKSQDLGWSARRAQKSAQEMYERMFDFRFLPPGRGLWTMGSPITEERGLLAAANNCGFVSTEALDKELTDPFVFLMDMSMLGVGVGFDTHGAGKLKIHKPIPIADPETGEPLYSPDEFVYAITDDREGWVESVRRLLASYFVPGTLYVDFDYSGIRKENLPIKGFGGVSSGPAPLKKLHKSLRKILDALVGELITETAIVDIMNMIGVCVVAGNVRRTAEIVFGSPDSEEYLNLKNYRWDAEKGKYVGPNAKRAEYGWTSNNSVFANVGMDYSKIADHIKANGEPGLFWLDNARAYSRTSAPPDNKDRKATGCNPCSEQTLESYEMCCLVETFPFNHDSLEDYRRTLKFAYLYAKTVTLGKTHWRQTNRVLLRNRRIGTSMSGIAQFVAKHGLHELKKWCEAGYETIEYYDKVYSDWFTVPLSIKKTSIKPSGSVSLVAGATPGMHRPENHYYIRRMRMGAKSDLVEPILAAGYPMEPAVDDLEGTLVVEVPVAVDENIPTVGETSIWEQVALAAFLQRYWADNQVSCTVTFAPHEQDEIAKTLEYFQYDLKGISFLPRLAKGAYAQMPYEAITREEYQRRVAQLKPLHIGSVHELADQERFCSSDVCEMPPAKAA